MYKQLEMMEEFHRAFGHPINEPHLLDSSKFIELRTNLHKEECQELYDELWDGCGYYHPEKRISPNLLKEGADLLYVLLGTYVALGLGEQLIEAFKRVHESNMSKLDKNGNPIYREDGKVMKGPNYKAPNLDDLIGTITRED